MTGRPPRVLILTAGYGSGHNAAAAALDAAFRAAGAETRVVDHFRTLVHPRFDRWSRALYDGLLYRAPALWGLAYRVGDWIAPSPTFRLDVNRLGSGALARLLVVEAPDGIVCTHPTPAGALGVLRARGWDTPPHAVVFSDFAVHSQWIHRAADVHYVPAEAIAREVVARGVPAWRVVATGIPLRREFAEPVDRAEARRALGLDAAIPVVLAMAGTFAWVGRLEATTRVLLRLGTPVQARVVAGADRAMAARLDRLVGERGPIRILGWVDNVRQLMAAADVLVTKAGGLTLAEALAAELPIVCFGSVPGHEARNAAFVVSAGAALRAGSARDLDRTLHRLLGAPEALAALREAGRAVRRPDASRAIVEHFLDLVLRRRAHSADRAAGAAPCGLAS